MVGRYVPNLLNDCKQNIICEAAHKVGDSEFGLQKT